MPAISANFLQEFLGPQRNFTHIFHRHAMPETKEKKDDEAAENGCGVWMCLNYKDMLHALHMHVSHMALHVSQDTFSSRFREILLDTHPCGFKTMGFRPFFLEMWLLFGRTQSQSIDSEHTPEHSHHLWEECSLPTPGSLQWFWDGISWW